MDQRSLLPCKTNRKKAPPLEIAIIYFSATGNTRKIAEAVRKKLIQLNVSITMLDITSTDRRKEDPSIGGYDAVFFGFPVYSSRAPEVCREWIDKLDGEGKKCSVFFTYGGFGKDPAHYYIKEQLEARDFSLVSTAEFLGSHTFNYSGWHAAEGRPHVSDLRTAEEYAVKTLHRFTGEDGDSLPPFSQPDVTPEQLDKSLKARSQLITQLPTRAGKECSMCMKCEQVCPVNAMDAKRGAADPETCISCFSCIAHCPEKVLASNDISATWEGKLQKHGMTMADMQGLKSRIYL